MCLFTKFVSVESSLSTIYLRNAFFVYYPNAIAFRFVYRKLPSVCRLCRAAENANRTVELTLRAAVVMNEVALSYDQEAISENVTPM